MFNGQKFLILSTNSLRLAVTFVLTNVTMHDSYCESLLSRNSLQIYCLDYVTQLSIHKILRKKSSANL